MKVPPSARAGTLAGLENDSFPILNLREAMAYGSVLIVVTG